ncbi:MAG: hypothetical protein ACPG4Z_04330 [Chitinophagales bacterium]
MYKDIISYKLAEGISQDDLIRIAQRVFNEWMKKQTGFIDWEITVDTNGNYTDIVSWQSKKAAKQAEKEMMNIPNGGEWFACYKEGSISSKNISQIAKF